RGSSARGRLPRVGGTVPRKRASRADGSPPPPGAVATFVLPSARGRIRRRLRARGAARGAACARAGPRRGGVDDGGHGAAAGTGGALRPLVGRRARAHAPRALGGGAPLA